MSPMNKNSQSSSDTRMSPAPHPLIKWFADITIADIPSVGGKNASLGEMVRELTGTSSRTSLTDSVLVRTT
ncbi:MAG: hypothetical protein R3C17_20240 [Planctomycetaceae bacterium]